jgi:hypothetical protein
MARAAKDKNQVLRPCGLARHRPDFGLVGAADSRFNLDFAQSRFDYRRGRIGRLVVGGRGMN